MDLPKAFDCIPHDLLIATLQACGLDEDALTLMSNYFRNIKQPVNIQGHNSECLYLCIGMPQGSISAPILSL